MQKATFLPFAVSAIKEKNKKKCLVLYIMLQALMLQPPVLVKNSKYFIKKDLVLRSRVLVHPTIK